MAHLHWACSIHTHPLLCIYRYLYILPDCGASQITFSGSRLRPGLTFPITAESDFPLDKAMISLSFQLEPHEGQFIPTPIGFEPKKGMAVTRTTVSAGYPNPTVHHTIMDSGIDILEHTN